MAALSLAQESRRAYQTDSREHVSYACVLKNQGRKHTDELEYCSIRFMPPLVISEEDLQKSIEIIKQALVDFDEVCIFISLGSPTRRSFMCVHSSRRFRGK